MGLTRISLTHFGLLFVGLFFVGLLLCTPGCAGPTQHQVLVKHAKAAEKRQAWLEAAQYYEQACAIKPKDTATCQRAQAMRDYGIEIRTYRARQLCEAGQLGPCVEEITPLLSVQSSKQNLVQSVVEQAGALAITECQAGGPSLPAALVELACLQYWQAPLWRGTAFREHFGKRSRSASGQLTILADSQAEPDVGARMSLLEAANCVAPLNTEQTAFWRNSANRFVAILTTPMRLRYTTNGTTREAPGTCATISKNLGRGLRCDTAKAGLASRPLEVDAEVFGVSPKWQRSHRDTEHVARYKAGTEQVVNPDYDRVRLEYELAETRQSDAERDMREQERRCNDTQSTSDCDSFDSLRRSFADRQRERDAARNRFNQESPTLTQDVYKDHHYVTRHHEWISPFRASVKLGGRDWAPEVTNVVYTDTEQTGFSPAGVQSDPFEAPVETYFRDQSSQWLTGRLQAHIDAEMRSRAADLVQQCQGQPIECWARARYLSGDAGYGLPLLQSIATQGAKSGMAVKHELRCTASLL